jgi:hypothetical protein
MSSDAEAAAWGSAGNARTDKALASRLGWPIVQQYSDNDLSASKYSHKPRQGYNQMLQGLQEGAINAVVVNEQDRLVRQPRELEELLEVCDRASAWHIAAVSGEIDVRNTNDHVPRPHPGRGPCQGVRQDLPAGPPQAAGAGRTGPTPRGPTPVWLARRPQRHRA